MKKTAKLLISVLLTMCMLLSIVSITAFATSDVYLDGTTLVVNTNSFASAVSGIAKTSYDKVVFTENVTSITGTTFKSNSNVKSFTFEGDVTIGDSAFQGSSALTEVIFKGECTIGKYGFMYARNLRRLIFNAKATVGEQAFKDCGTATGVTMLPLYIPASSTLDLNSMRESAFTEIYVMGDNVTLSSYSFYENYSLKSLTVYGENCKLGNHAFDSCTALESACFYGTVDLDQYTFYGDTALTDITFKKAVKLWSGEFYGTKITELTIPHGSTTTMSGSFSGMKYLETLIFEDYTPMSFYASAFLNVPKNVKIVVPEGAEEAYSAAIGRLATNQAYINNVVTSADASDVIIAVNNTELGTIETNLGGTNEKIQQAYSISFPEDGTLYTYGEMNNGDTLQIFTEPIFGYKLSGVWLMDLEAGTGEFEPCTDNKYTCTVSDTTSIEVVFEAITPDTHNDLKWCYDTNAHWQYCNTCQKVTGNIANHTFDDNGVCECGCTEESIDQYLNEDLASYTIDTKNGGNIPLWVGGVKVTESNCDDILGDGDVSFDKETSTLYLDSARILNGNVSDGVTQSVIYSELDDLKINVFGNCLLGCNYSLPDLRVIYCTGMVEIVSDNDYSILNLDVGSASSFCVGIFAENVYINTRVSINAYDAFECCRGIWGLESVFIENCCVQVESTMSYFNYCIENIETILVRYNAAIYCQNGYIAISDADVVVNGYYNGICIEKAEAEEGEEIVDENFVTLANSTVSITCENIGIYGDELRIINLKNLYIDAKLNYDLTDGTDNDDNVYYGMIKDKYDDSEWFFVNSSNCTDDMLTTYTLSMSRSDYIFPETGNSMVLGQAEPCLESDKTSINCGDGIRIDAYYYSTNAKGNIGGLTRLWYYTDDHYEEKQLDVDQNANSIVVYPENVSDDEYITYFCDTYCGDKFLGRASITVMLIHNTKFENGNFTGADNACHTYTCGCGNNSYSENHNYDKNGVCKSCGYKRVNLTSDTYSIDNIKQYVIVDDMASASLSESDFTASDETCFTEIFRGSTVQICRAGQILADYTLVDKSVFTYGDITNDGWIDGQDAVIATCIMDGLLTMDDVGYVAYTVADFNKNGVIEDDDIDVMMQAGLLLMSVDTTQSKEVLLETSEEYREYLALIGQEPVTEEPEQSGEQTSVIDYIMNIIITIFNFLVNFVKGLT